MTRGLVERERISGALFIEDEDIIIWNVGGDGFGL